MLGFFVAWNDERLHCQLVSNLYMLFVCVYFFFVGGGVTTACCALEKSTRLLAAPGVFLCTFITVKSGCSNKILHAGGGLSAVSAARLAESCLLLLFTEPGT